MPSRDIADYEDAPADDRPGDLRRGAAKVTAPQQGPERWVGGVSSGHILFLVAGSEPGGVEFSGRI